MTFIFAGTDTTTNLFIFASIVMFEHPEALQKAKEEVASVIKSEEDLTFDNLKKLTYLEAIQWETMRMHSPVAGNLLRTCTQDTLFGDIPLSKGTNIAIRYKPMLYDPNIFPRPHDFKPERWQGDNK